MTNDPALLAAIKRLHTEAPNPVRVVLSMAGNGMEGVSELMRHGRGSSTLIRQTLHYAQSGLYEYLGIDPVKGRDIMKPVSEHCARLLAGSACREARRLSGPSEIDAVGIGTTSALAKPDGEREERPHSIHVAAHSRNFTRSVTIKLARSLNRSREEEEWINSLAIMNMVATVRGFENLFDFRNLLRGVDEVVENVVNADRDLMQLLAGGISHVVAAGDMPTGPCVLIPGSFNPLHDTHRDFGRIGNERTDLPAVYELSVVNAESFKPPLDFIEIANRVKQFKDEGRTLVLTNKPLLVDKIRLFSKGTVVALGIDTLRRFADVRYYGWKTEADRDAENRVCKAISEFMAHECRFLCFARRNEKGVVETMDDLPISLFDIGNQVPPEVYLSDLSSTAIRRKQWAE